MAFATHADVQTRLGRDLTDAEEDQVDLIIEGVQGLIAEAVGKDAAWASALTPVPATLKFLCIEKAVGIAANPESLVQASEQLGSYQHSATYEQNGDGLAGFFLSDEEERRARRAVYGRTTDSVPMGSIFREAETS